MATTFNIVRADFALDAVYQRPEFATLRDSGSLLARLYSGLEPHGIKLSDFKVERGAGSLADFHVLCYLFDFLLTIRIRLDRVDVVGSSLSKENITRFSTAVIDALHAVRAHLNSDYRAYSLSLNLHGTLGGLDVKEYLGQFVAKRPKIGPAAGSAVAYYFGPEDDRLIAAITLDVSAAVAGALYVRPHATWDGNRVRVDALPGRARQFLSDAMGAIELEIPLFQ